MVKQKKKRGKSLQVLKRGKNAKKRVVSVEIAELK